MKKTPRPFTAPLILFGALFLTASCQEKHTPTWSQATEVSEQVQTKSAGTAPNTEGTSPTSITEEKIPAKPAPVVAEKPKNENSATPKEGSVRFMAYNIKNYLSMDRTVQGERESFPKPDEEIEALTDIIVQEKPDILGICEIGTEDDLLDLQKSLKAKGLDLPHHEYAFGWDNTRRLGLLSKYPVKASNSESELFYQLAGSKMQFSRGILDATITLPGGDTHFIGLHLKSKRELPRYDQELMRQNEALLARKHCDELLEKNPETRLIVYGDFNDTRRTPTVANLQGRSNSHKHLNDVPLTDSRGEVWTHYWDYQDSYARFDYILVSKSMGKAYNLEKSHVVDAPTWNQASDHRALLLVIEN